MLLLALFYTIWIVNGLCCFFRTRSRFVEILSLIFFYILTIGNSFNSDYPIYERDYLSNALNHNSASMSSYDIGFMVLGKIATSFGLDYKGFLCLFLIPCYTLLLIIVFKRAKEIHTFIFMYFFVLVFYDLNQIRNLVVAIFLTCAVLELIDGKKIRAFLFILFGGLFHRIAFVYLALFLLDPKKIIKTKIYKLLIIQIGLFIVVTIANNNQIPGLKQLISLISSDYIANYYTSSRINHGFLIPLVQLLADIGLVYLSAYYLKQNGLYEYYEKSIQWAMSCLLLGFLLCPLLLIDLTYDRIFRNFSFLIYIIVSKTLFSFNNTALVDRRKVSLGFVIYFAYILAFGFSWRVGTVIRYGNEINEIYRVLHNNWILGVQLLK